MAARTSTKGPYLNIMLEHGLSKTMSTPRANAAAEYNNVATHTAWFLQRTEAHPALPSYMADLRHLVRDMLKNSHEAHTGAIQSRPPFIAKAHGERPQAPGRQSRWHQATAPHRSKAPRRPGPEGDRKSLEG
jgi:hypothetical protein